MPRRIRLNKPGTTYHLISRFVDRDWFIRCDAEREHYLELLGRALRESDWRCLAYALMSSHLHLAMLAGEEPLKAWVSRVHPSFASWMNDRHDRIGPMFVRGPRDYKIWPGAEPKLLAYLHNNPVRAGVVARASDTTWTSHRAYIGMAPQPHWLNVELGMAMTTLTRPADFDAWVDVTPGEGGYVSVAEARRLARQRGAVDVATPTAGPTDIPLVARPWARVRPDPRLVISATAAVLGVPVAEVCSRRRSPAIVAARRVAVHGGLALGLTATDMAVALGVSQQATSVIARQPLSETTQRAACQQVIEACGNLCK